MKTPWCWFALLLVAGLAGCATAPEAARSAWKQRHPVARGVHVLIGHDSDLTTLQGQLDRLAGAGVNTLIVEIGYNFQFVSHPELAAPTGVTAAHAHAFAAAARRRDLRVIPELDCLGHQSWSSTTHALLRAHPEFDETPGQFPGNANIYCRSWCPQNPAVYGVVFDLIDELAAAFESDAFHVGMDEVFLIASEYCPRCRGGDPAKLFARAVNDLHGHIVGRRKLEMFMWGDRLLDAQAMNGGEWEYAKNGTAGAVDLIPKDIVVCDWHYTKQATYPSVPFLLAKGFRVWPSTFQPLEDAKSFSAFARREHNDRIIGILCTVWGKTDIAHVADWPPVTDVLADWK